jgi:hypothetical protein
MPISARQRAPRRRHRRLAGLSRFTEQVVVRFAFDQRRLGRKEPVKEGGGRFPATWRLLKQAHPGLDLPGVAEKRRSFLTARPRFWARARSPPGRLADHLTEARPRSRGRR